MNTYRIPIEDRFFSKVNQNGPYPKNRKLGRCWSWTGTVKSRVVNHQRYGLMGKGGKHGGSVRAHRVSWTIHFGSIPTGKFILHVCDNSNCVHPNHLFLGTQGDNIRDMWNKGRGLSGEKAPWSRLTESQVSAIRSSSLSQSVLAWRFGIAQQTVSEIKLGKIWRTT